MTKPRKTRIQRIEGQLRRARRDITELQEILYIQGNIQIDQGNRLSVLTKTVKTDIARVSDSVRVANVWLKAMQCRVYRLETSGFWNWLFGRKYRRKTKHEAN